MALAVFNSTTVRAIDWVERVLANIGTKKALMLSFSKGWGSKNLLYINNNQICRFASSDDSTTRVKVIHDLRTSPDGDCIIIVSCQLLQVEDEGTSTYYYQGLRNLRK